MITGTSQRALAHCDWPGCKASLDMANVEGTSDARVTLAQLLPDYGWVQLASGQTICDEASHRVQALEAWLSS